MTRRLAVKLGLVLVAALPLGMSACSSTSTSGSAATTTTSSAAADTTLPKGLVRVTPAEGNRMIDSMGSVLTVIDVRTPAEFAAGHVRGAVNLDLEGGQFSADIATLNRSATYLVYCHTGRRSAIATAAMIAAGFTHLYDVAGGITAWTAAGLPVVAG
jgi:rhodanese-related sulfurtransferase